MRELLQSFDWRYQPIPKDSGNVSEWKKEPIAECGEPLVSLGMFGQYSTILTVSNYAGEAIDSAYFGRPLEGSLLTMYVRKPVAQALEKGEALLHSEDATMFTVVKDAYRTLRAQRALFDNFAQALAKLHPDWDEEKVSAETQKMVSLPSDDPQKPSPHYTGGSVDVSIIQLPPTNAALVHKLTREIKNIGGDPHSWKRVYELEMQRNTLLKAGKELDFGVPFDHGSEKAGLAFFEKEEQKRILTPDEVVARDNRRLLDYIMTAAGFERYEHEYWHWNMGNQMAAKTAGAAFAVYGGIDLTKEQLEFEEMKKAHFLGSESIRRGAGFITKHNAEKFIVVFCAARQNPSLTATNITKGEEIAPVAA